MTISRPHIAVLAFAACLAAALFGPLASANASTQFTAPTATDSRDFKSSAGGWTYATASSGLLCIPNLTCPMPGAEWVSTGGMGGTGDGYVRATFSTLIGLASGGQVTLNSPTFTAPGTADSGQLRLNLRNNLGSLLTVAGGSATLKSTIVDVDDATRNVPLADYAVTGAGINAVQLTVPTGQVVAGRRYQVQLVVDYSATLLAIAQTGNVALDDVNLTLTSLQKPTALSATASTTGQVAINGSVNPNTLATSVRVSYGPTASYGTTTTPVQVTGTGAKAFSIPLAGLTAGNTYHYKVVADNADGTSETQDATFTVPFIPGNAVPNVTGALNSTSRTVVYDVLAGTTGVTVQVLNGAGDVLSSTVDNTPNDGTVNITLPSTDGTYGVRIKRDGAGGGTSTSARVDAVLDTGAPSTAGMNASLAPSLSSDFVRTVSFTMPSDAVSAEAQVIDAQGNPVGGPVTATGGNASVTLGNSDGDYRVRVTVRDLAGNTATVTTGAVTLDRSAPAAGNAPVVTGADSGRPRTVTFDRDPSAVNAIVEVTDTNGTVVAHTDVASGNQGAVTLPDTDGTYFVRVRQTDAAGNISSNTNQTQITLDRQPPAAGSAPTVTGPIADVHRSVSFTRPVDAATATIEAVDRNGQVQAVKVVASGGADTITLPATDGDYDIRVRFADTAGNESLTPATRVTLDTTVPGTVNDAPVVSGATNSAGRTVTFTRDGSATSVEILVSYGNGAPVAQPVAGSSDTITLGSGDGTYHVAIKQVIGGTPYTSPARDVTLDTQAPNAGGAPTVTGPRNDVSRTVTFTRAGDATQVTVEIVANGNVISTVPVANGSSAPITLGSWDGEYFVQVRQTDAAGNTAVTTQTRTVLDRTAPVAGPAPTVSGADNDATRHVEFTRASDTAAATIEIVDGNGVVVDSIVLPTDDEADVTLATDGAYKVRVRQVDAAGNASTTPETDLTLDRGAPAASGAPNVTGAVTSRTRTVTFTRANDAAVVKVEAVRNGVTTTYDVPNGAGTDIVLPNTDGDYVIRVRQFDAAGNDSVSPDTTVSLDRTGPAAGGAPTVTGAVNAPARHVTFTRADDTTNARVEVVDANGTVVATANVPTGNEADVTLPGDGTYTVRVRQQDAAGNDSVTPLTTVKLDRNGPVAGPAPTVTGDGNSLTRHVTFTRAGDAVDATIVVVKAADGSETTFNVPSGNEGDITLPTADGTYTVYVRQTNGNGNVSDTPVTSVSLDRSAPAAGGAPTVTGAVTARQRAVTFVRANDAVSTRIEVLDAGNTVVATTDVANGNAGTVTLPDADGTYRVRVRQTDAAGNDAVTPSTNVALDRTGPAAGGAPTVTGATTARDRTVTFTRAGDTTAATVEVLDANGTVIASVPAAGNSAAITLPNVDGAYTIRVVQTDAAGNTSVTPPAGATLTRGTTGTGGEETGTGGGNGGGTPTTPTTPTTPSTEAVASDPGGFGSLLTDCYGAAAGKLVLSDVALKGSTVAFAGLSVYAPGTKIAIVDSKQRTVATATADATGRFAVKATAPVKAERKTIRYTAVVGTVKTKALKLVRATALTGVAVSGNVATLSGKITGAKGAVKLAVRGGRGATACKGGGGKLKFVGKAKYNRKTGKFSVKVALPKGTAGKTAVRVRVSGGIKSASLYVIK